eukprot:SM000059S18664  [mRNA]  locus=s59:209716:213101:- [translate_table: standard]
MAGGAGSGQAQALGPSHRLAQKPGAAWELQGPALAAEVRRSAEDEGGQELAKRPRLDGPASHLTEAQVRVLAAQEADILQYLQDRGVQLTAQQLRDGGLGNQVPVKDDSRHASAATQQQQLQGSTLLPASLSTKQALQQQVTYVQSRLAQQSSPRHDGADQRGMLRTQQPMQIPSTGQQQQQQQHQPPPSPSSQPTVTAPLPSRPTPGPSLQQQLKHLVGPHGSRPASSSAPSPPAALPARPALSSPLLPVAKQPTGFRQGKLSPPLAARRGAAASTLPPMHRSPAQTVGSIPTFIAAESQGGSAGGGVARPVMSAPDALTRDGGDFTVHSPSISPLRQYQHSLATTGFAAAGEHRDGGHIVQPAGSGGSQDWGRLGAETRRFARPAVSGELVRSGAPLPRSPLAGHQQSPQSMPEVVRGQHLDVAACPGNGELVEQERSRSSPLDGHFRVDVASRTPVAPLAEGPTRSVANQGQAEKQMTIFYGREIHVFDDVSEEQAKKIMLLAAAQRGKSYSTSCAPTEEPSVSRSMQRSARRTYSMGDTIDSRPRVSVGGGGGTGSGWMDGTVHSGGSALPAESYGGSSAGAAAEGFLQGLRRPGGRAGEGSVAGGSSLLGGGDAGGGGGEGSIVGGNEVASLSRQLDDARAGHPQYAAQPGDWGEGSVTAPARGVGLALREQELQPGRVVESRPNVVSKAGSGAFAPVMVSEQREDATGAGSSGQVVAGTRPDVDLRSSPGSLGASRRGAAADSGWAAREDADRHHGHESPAAQGGKPTVYSRAEDGRAVIEEGLPRAAGDWRGSRSLPRELLATSSFLTAAMPVDVLPVASIPEPRTLGSSGGGGGRGRRLAAHYPAGTEREQSQMAWHASGFERAGRHIESPRIAPQGGGPGRLEHDNSPASADARHGR